MIPRLETIRRHLSWCPNAATARTCWQGAVPGDEGVGEARAVGGGRAAMGGAFVDYGPADISTATSVAMALAGVGLFILAIYLSIAHPPSGNLLLLAIVLALAGGELYKVMQKTSIEITRDAVTFRRPVLPAIVIPKADIVKVEVRESRLPRLPWHIVALVGVILVSAVASINSSLSNPTSMRFILGVTAVIFFPAMTYGTYVRTRYPKIVTVTTVDKRVATIYAPDPGQVAHMLEVT
ncbi:MAG: hypothetical protein RQM90_15660 [Methanoculleus sp.]